MEPENDGFQKESLFPGVHVQVKFHASFPGRNICGNKMSWQCDNKIREACLQYCWHQSKVTLCIMRIGVPNTWVDLDKMDRYTTEN